MYHQLSTQSNDQEEENTSIQEPSNSEESSEIEQQNNNEQEVTQNEEQQHQGLNGQQGDTIAPTAGSIQLPFHNFKERWNSVTEEQMSNLYIQSMEEVKTSEKTIYCTQINSEITLSIATFNNYVESLEMTNTGKSRDNIYNMLTGWSQMISIIHPDMEIHDVDTIFNRIGVGPNADLTYMKSTSFTYLNLHYDLSITDKGYSFKVSYVNS